MNESEKKTVLKKQKLKEEENQLEHRLEEMNEQKKHQKQIQKEFLSNSKKIEKMWVLFVSYLGTKKFFM